MKTHTTISIDGEILKKAQERAMNISQTTEKALREAVFNKIEVSIKEPTKCDFCGKPEDKATRENEYKGITWLYPDERWICDACLKREGIKISASKA